MTSRKKIFDKVLEETERALEKEKQAHLDYSRHKDDSKWLMWLEWMIKASGYTNGLLEALKIIKSVEEEK